MRKRGRSVLDSFTEKNRRNFFWVAVWFWVKNTLINLGHPGKLPHRSQTLENQLKESPNPQNPTISVKLN
jgi:hypothetical protein